MDRDIIIQLAREAGISESHAQGMHGFLERFAALVAAAEREACAKEADYEAARWPYAPEAREPCEEIAKAIRSRT